MMKLAALVCVFVGELLAIGAELMAARKVADGATWWQAFTVCAVPMLAGSLLLLAGYVMGYVAFRNIWLILVISVCSIVIVEPLLIRLWFQELPTQGAWIGMALGVLGLVVAVVW